MENLFSSLVVKPKKKRAVLQKEQVLDVKRATAVGILMSRMRLNWKEMPRAIFTMSDDVFQSVEDAETLLNIIPTDDEVKLLKRFLEKASRNNSSRLEADKSDRPTLSDAEEFMIMLMTKFPVMLQRRAQVLMVIKSSPALINEIEESIVVFRNAVRQIKTSKCFSNVVDLTLIIGNFMNYGTRLGNAAGFKINALLRLKDTRASSGQMTLLHYIVKVRKYHPDCFLDAGRYPGCPKIAKCGTSDLESIGRSGS